MTKYSISEVGKKTNLGKYISSAHNQQKMNIQNLQTCLVHYIKKYAKA